MDLSDSRRLRDERTTNERTNKRTNERTNKRADEQATNDRTKEQTNEHANERANERTNKRTNKRTNEGAVWIHGYQSISIDIQKDESIHKLIVLHLNATRRIGIIFLIDLCEELSLLRATAARMRTDATPMELLALPVFCFG